MESLRIFNALIEEGFSTEIALTTVQAFTIHLSIPPKTKEMIAGDGTYGVRVNELIRKVLWETSPEVLETAMALEACIHDWECCQGFDGLGGCSKKTFRELLAYQRVANLRGKNERIQKRQLR